MLTAAVSLGAIAASGYGHRAPAPRLAAAAAPAKAHEAAPAPTPEKSTTSPSRPAPQPTKTIVVTQPPQVIIQNPPAQAPAAPHPASALRYVGSGIYAGPSTSDAFALNVVAAWDGTPGVKYVYSPVTGQTYAMTYQIVGVGTVIHVYYGDIAGAGVYTGTSGSGVNMMAQADARFEQQGGSPQYTTLADVLARSASSGWLTGCTSTTCR